jgi:hypothetical protein
MNQEQLEKKLMEMFLHGDEPVLEKLREQYRNSETKSRKYTGVGFYTYFKILSGIAPLISIKNFEITDVTATLDQKDHALGFVLFIRDGYISWLEGYTMAIDDWPDDYSKMNLVYSGPDGKRDLNKLISRWS